MKILCDVDGCMLDMLGAIKRRNNKFLPSGVTDYNFKNETYGISRGEVIAYLGDEVTFRFQKPYRGAKEGIKQLNTLGEVCAWTKVSERLFSYRDFQCHELGIDTKYIYTVKKDTDIDDVLAVIEDCVDNLNLWKDKGVYRFIIDRPYNRESAVGKEALEGTYRVKNLLEVYDILKKLMRNA